MDGCVHFGLKRTRWAAVLALSAVLGGFPAAASDGEDELKSAIVWAFLQYSDWSVRPAADTPITVGVLGRSAFRQFLGHYLEGKTVNNRPVRVVEVKAVTDLHGCAAVYFATDKGTEIKQLLPAARAAHALTVGETDRFVEWGGAVNLFLVDGHMSFEVSLGTLEQSGIAISSKLLRWGQIRDLAKIKTMARPAQ
ncbi:MAG: YfiR family protein [Acidobacteriia bacterium]|nr:YfiR family protein [Terriglobia bacterium]